MTLRRLVPGPLAAAAARLREQAMLRKQRRRLVRIAAYRRPPADADALLAAVRRKNLVFTITAGRTGTAYLQRLLGLFPDTTSLHEPEPAFVSVLRLVQHAPERARSFLLEYKLPFIAAVPTGRYVEASHLFGKGFLEPALLLGLMPRLVLLRRHPRRIALSYLARNAVPGRTKLGFKYLLQPSDPGVLPLPDWTRRSAYQLCFWYALEMERRQCAYAARMGELGGAWVDVTAEELHEVERFFAVARTLHLLDPSADLDAVRRRHRELSAVTHNPNRSVPAPRAAVDADEEAVWAAIEPFAPDLRRQVAVRYATEGAPQGCAAGEGRG
jgi:hypothetical protein